MAQAQPLRRVLAAQQPVATDVAKRRAAEPRRWAANLTLMTTVHRFPKATVSFDLTTSGRLLTTDPRLLDLWPGDRTDTVSDRRPPVARVEASPDLHIPDWCGCTTEDVPVPTAAGRWQMVPIWELDQVAVAWATAALIGADPARQRKVPRWRRGSRPGMVGAPREQGMRSGEPLDSRPETSRQCPRRTGDGATGVTVARKGTLCVGSVGSQG
jgi:hypothetical protein